MDGHFIAYIVAFDRSCEFFIRMMNDYKGIEEEYLSTNLVVYLILGACRLSNDNLRIVRRGPIQ